MHRITPRDTAFRAFHGAARATLDAIDDNPLMQEAKAAFMRAEGRKGIERWQQYGFTAVPLPRDEQQQQGGQNSGGDGDLGAANRTPSAEALMAFLGGNRSHPVIVGIDDRRHRLAELQPGEAALFNHLTQQIHLALTGIWSSVPHGLRIVQQVMRDGEKVRRSGKPGAPGGGQQQSGQQQQSQGDDGYGQTPWIKKTAYADQTLDKDKRTVRHPKKIAHQVVQDGNLESVKHYSQVTDAGGVKPAADNEAHTITVKGGVATASTTNITDTAPAIGHNGNTSVTGTLGVTQALTALSVTETSDRRLKTAVKPARFGLDVLRRLRVVEFEWKKDRGRRVQGFIAQQMQRVFPQAVAHGGRPGAPKTLAVDVGQVLALAVKSIQDLSAEVDELRAKLERLERKRA